MMPTAEKSVLPRWLAVLAGPLVILLALAAGSFTAVVRSTRWLEPSRAVTIAPGSAHQALTPCLRYPAPPAPHLLNDAAEALADAGLTELIGLTGDIDARAASRESVLHAQNEVDEYLDAMAAQGSLVGRLVIAVKRDLLREELTRAFAGASPINRTIVGLPVEQRAAFEAQWEREPSVFIRPALGKLNDRLAIVVTGRRLDLVLAGLEKQIAAGEQPDLARLGMTSMQLQDEWLLPFKLEWINDRELRLMSHDQQRTLAVKARQLLR